MKPVTLVLAIVCLIIGVAIGLSLNAAGSSTQPGPVAPWLEVVHRITTAVGGLCSAITLVVVLRQFYLLRTQSELVQKNVVASVDSQLYSRLDSFNRFLFEHSQEYDLLDLPYAEIKLPDQRSKLHRMCELGYTFFEEIFKHHVRLKLLETEDWEEWEQNLIHFFSKPYVRGYWKVIASRYARSFQLLVNEQITRLESLAK